MANDTINFKDSINDPISRDVGNYVTQGRTVSKTVKFGLFTTNANAVWAGTNQLRKESYPFATIKIPVNRNQFRLQVGGVFKLNYAKYGISGMICRILLVEEANLLSEKIFLHVMEDIFSVAKGITVYTSPVNSHGSPPDYTPVAFTVDAVFEAPYVMTTNLEIIPLAKREIAADLGMQVHLSLDGGSSYTQIDQKNNIQPYGTLNADYDAGEPIDGSIGMTVSFVESDIDNIDTITFQEALAGGANMLIVGDEIMTFQTITPVSGTIYTLSNIIRGRYGTVQENHLTAAGVWIITKNIGMVASSEFLPGAARKIKMVPFNNKLVGVIADATPLSITPTGKGLTPYIPVNFNGNGASFASRYSSNIVLTWSARKRGEGAGVGAPGIVLAESDHEGLFTVEVWVLSVLKRTTTAIDALTWTYTSAMNITDNGALADEVEFVLTNYREEGGITYTSSEVNLTTKEIV